ncbi:mucin-5AC-like [Mytilus trossulus]|uniref:mucin-5AC-like n=1 Tax=Mytilus trossulus TaxID=6551 RepID=UPI0030043D75
MILKVDLFFGFCVFSVNSAFNITTGNRERKSLREHGINTRDSMSTYFKVKPCEETFMDLVSNSFGSVSQFYRVHFGREKIYLIENPESVLDIDNTTWPTYHCDHNVPYWVSWTNGTLEAGVGICIGHDKFNRDWTRRHNIYTDVTDISVMSYITAHWLFYIPKNTKSACAPDELDIGSGSGPTIIRTTKTTTPEFAPTTISSTDTGTSEFAPTTISSTDTATSEFAPTTISSTDTTTPQLDLTGISTAETTTPGFYPTTKSSTETTTPELDLTGISTAETKTPEFDPTTKSSTETTTPELDLTGISTTETTTPIFDPTKKSSTDTTTPELDLTGISSTDTTTPELDLTGISSTDTTTPELDLTGISSTDTTTPELDLTGIRKTETTTSGFDQTRRSSTISTSTTTTRTTPIDKPTERSPTKTPCTCPCNNFTMTEDELIRKIALLKLELAVDRKQTNKYKRSLTSASDDRPSSKYIGTIGIVVLVVICTLIVLMDLQHCACFMFHKKK